jgi:hypothetical protein
MDGVAMRHDLHHDVESQVAPHSSRNVLLARDPAAREVSF